MWLYWFAFAACKNENRVYHYEVALLVRAVGVFNRTCMGLMELFGATRYCSNFCSALLIYF
jgi:hypothetical protein